MSDNIRVCQVLHGIVGGGSEQVVLNYCSRMHDIHFDLLYQYEPNPQILERFNEAGINCIQIPDKVHHPLKHLWIMYKIFKQGKYDVVHCHLDWFLNSYACFIAMLAGIKKRIAHHHQAYRSKNLLLLLLCIFLRIPNKVFATHWLACSKDAAIDGWGNGAVKKGKVKILANAIDPQHFKFNELTRQKIRAQYGLAESDYVIGHVGRFYPQKNHEFLIDVFEKIYKQKPNAKLLLLGEGPLQNKIRQKVNDLDIAKAVIFAGLQKDPAPFYNAMDVFCLPSLWEGLGIVLLEAQYNGLPCVVSDAIPKEAQITDNFSYCSFNIINWIHRLTEMKRIHPQIKNQYFDINSNIDKLRTLYYT
jgi:glycosyltransferase EpsF